MNLDKKIAIGIVIAIGIFTLFLHVNTFYVVEKREKVELQKELQEIEDSILREEYWNLLRAKERYVSPLPLLWISSKTGYRTNPMGGGEERLHKGVDIVAPRGTPVRAIMDGIVVEHWLAPGTYWGTEYYGHPIFGGMVVIDHGGELFSVYGHLDRTNVEKVNATLATPVKKGEVIGWLGDTGKATGPHLHFELVINPFRLLENLEDI